MSLRFLLCGLSLLFIAGCPLKKSTIAQAIPQTEVQNINKEKVSLLSITQGKVAVVDLWATWCEPCKETLPKLERLANAYGPAGLLVLGVDVGEEDFAAVQAFALKIPVTYPLYFDPSFAFVDSLGSTKVPTLLVLDRSGRIVHRSSSLDEQTLQIIRAQLSLIQ
jgi:cytochrome c biogenesis protein CcmG, thiol:disulfide interchange protein DsbE